MEQYYKFTIITGRTAKQHEPTPKKEKRDKNPLFFFWLEI